MIGSTRGRVLPPPSTWHLRALAQPDGATMWHWYHHNHEGSLLAQSAKGYTDYEECLTDAMLHGYRGFPGS